MISDNQVDPLYLGNLLVPHLGVAANNRSKCLRVAAGELADGIATLGVSRARDSTSIDHGKICIFTKRHNLIAAIDQLITNQISLGLIKPAAKCMNGSALGHVDFPCHKKEKDEKDASLSKKGNSGYLLIPTIMPEIPYSKVFLSLLVIAGWAIIGMMLRRFGILNPKWDGMLLRTVIWCFYPCLILKNVMGNKALADEPSLLLTILFIGFLALAIGEVAASLAARWVPFENPRQRNTFIFTTGIFNYGYFAFPVAEALFGQETFGILLVFVVGVEVAIWSVGILYLTSGEEKLDWKRLVNPPIIAVAMALTLNWSGVAKSLTPESIRMLDFMGQLAIPLGLILIGATLFDNLKSLNLRKHVHQVVMACCVRQLFLPSAFIIAAILLPVLPEIKAVLVVEAAMPCGIFPIVIAKHYGGSPNTALQIILGTTFLSVVTIPFWIVLGMHLTGLHGLVPFPY